MRARRLAWVLLLTALLVVAGVFSYAGMRGLGSRVFPQAFRPSDSRTGLALSGQRVTACDASLRVAPDPAEAGSSLTVGVSLLVESLEAERDTFCFLLNSGLRIEEATVDGARARWSQSGNLLRITCAESVAQGQRASIHLRYSGVLGASAYERGWVERDAVFLPMLSLWLPLDLNSFFQFRCEATIPAAWTPVLGLDAQSNDSGDGRKTLTWEEKRPILGASFGAGSYAVQERTHGQVRCLLFTHADTSVDTAGVLDTVGSSYSYLRALYGTDGFDVMCVLVDPRVAAPGNAGNSVVVLPGSLSGDSREQFAVLARLVAHNWWGGTVTGRWFPQQPEAATWMVDGFAEHSAWTALRGLKGREEFLRFIETRRCPPGIGFPMKAISMPDRYGQTSVRPETDPAYRLVRQAYTVNSIQERMGRKRFEDACANILKIHRYTALSYAAVLQELELAGEVDLREFFRLWFERSGTFDYSVSDVAQDGESLRVTVDNPGDIPYQGRVVLALVSGASVFLHEFDAGPDGGSFLVPVTGPVERVILDPEFRTPDMLRGNNVWPRTHWPRYLSASSSGHIALAATDEWCAEGARHLAIATSQQESFLRVDLPDALSVNPLWSGDGQTLLMAGTSPSTWSERTGVHAVDASALIPAGWAGDSLLLATRQSPASWQTAQVGGRPASVAPCSALPTPLSARVHEGSGRVAYIAGDRRVIVEALSKKDAQPISLGCAAIGNLAWAAGGDAVIFMSDANALVRQPADGTAREPLLRLDQSVTRFEVAPGATWVAWTSADRTLRCCSTQAPLPSEVPLPGEAAAFSWAGDETLVVLVAEVLRELPMRCHARHSLWRYAPATQTLERVPLDASRVF